MIYKYDKEDKLIVAVDCIVFGFDNDGLKILLIKRSFEPRQGQWSLMGGFLKKKETLANAAQRVLKALTGMDQIYLEQLEAYSEIDRDPVERTISVAYSALININFKDTQLLTNYEAKWFPITAVPDLIFDHQSMVKRAIRRLKHKAKTQPIGLELLPQKFTILQLQKLYEAIFNIELDKRNFNKKINDFDILIKLNEKDMLSSKKGSFLYQFNIKKYRKKLKGGIVFKI